MSRIFPRPYACCVGSGEGVSEGWADGLGSWGCLLVNGQTFLLAALAVLPCCILLAFFVRNDQVEASSRGFRIIAPSILGALTAPLALAVQTAIRPYWDVDPVTITVSSAVYCFAVIALSEEGLKFTVAWIFRRRFKEPYDGIVFAVAAAMGFALVENVRYVFAAGLETGLMRSVLAVPAHALFGVCIGYFLGRARFCRKFSQRVWNTVAAFGWAWAMHGAYDCTLIYAGKGPSLLLFPLVGIFWLAALWEMDLHISQSPFRYYPRGDRRVWARYQLDSPARVFPLDQAGEGIPVFIHDIGLGGRSEERV